MEGEVRNEAGKTYISLVSPDEVIASPTSKRVIETKKVRIGDLGLVYLEGNIQGNSYFNEDIGTAFINGKLVKGRAEKFNKMGLFDMIMIVDLVQRPDVVSKIKCEVLTPDNKIFYAHFKYFEDSYIPDPKEKESNEVIADWISEDGEEVAFFTDGKPDTLSKFRFNFTTE